MIEVNHLRYFFEVAKSGSFSEAARRLHISQSALSKAVANLEDREGVKLLERSKKGVELTKVGAEVFAKSQGVFQTLTEIESVCRGTKETCSGLLRMGASDHISNYLLVDQLSKMRSSHPLVIPSLMAGTPNEIVSAITALKIEFGLFFTRVPSPGIDYEVVRSIEMTLACHPQFAKSIRQAAKPSQLRETLNEIGFIGSIGAHYQHHPSETLIKLAGEQPTVNFEASSQETQKRLCLERGGIAFLARFMLEEELKSKALIEIPLPKPIRLDLLIASRRNQALSLSARTFIDMMRDKLD